MKKHRKLLTFGVVICLAAGIVAGIFYYKQTEEERNLSLIYIPKVVDGTNDFWTSLIQGAEMAAKEYNADICSALGITVPDDYVAIETE